MNKKVVIEALIDIRNCINTIIDQIAEEKDSTAVPSVPTQVDTPEADIVPVAPTRATTAAGKTRKERESAEVIPTVITAESLDSLSYNTLKKLAKERGISASGSRDELTSRLLENPGEISDSPNLHVVRSEAEAGDEPEVEDAADVEEEEDIDSILKRVNEAVADLSNEELMDILTDVGVKAKGKRQSLIEATVRAVKDGLLDLSDDEDEEGGEDTADEDDTQSECEYEPNDTDNPDMTEERRAAIQAFIEEATNDFKKGNITRKELIEWLNEFNGTKDPMKKSSDEEILNSYIHASCLLINDEGEFPEEEGAYTVNGIPYCCGRALKCVETDGVTTYICETCGNEYEA